MNRTILFFFFCLYWHSSIAQVLVYTGTFDPPHDGHKEILLQAIEQVSPRLVFVNPGPTDHKPEASPLQLRLVMAEQAFLSIPNVEFPPLEVSEAFWDKEDNRAMERLATLYPSEEMYRVVGTDRLAWETAETIRQAPYNFLVSARSADVDMNPEIRALINQKIFFLPAPELSISSTLMRGQITQGIQPETMETEVFETYIEHRAEVAPRCHLIFN